MKHLPLYKIHDPKFSRPSQLFAWYLFWNFSRHASDVNKGHMDDMFAIPIPRKTIKEQEYDNGLVVLYKRNNEHKVNLNYFSDRILSSSRPLL
jgi:hypothetical protein